MNKNRLIISLITVVVATVIIVVILKKEIPGSVISHNTTDSSLVKTSKDFTWESLPIEKVWEIIKKERDVYFWEDFGIKLYRSVDLTGDGISEGIYQGDGGNNDAVVVLMRDSDGTINVAKYKLKDTDIIEPVYLVAYGKASASEEYDFLPEEKAFYTVMKYTDLNRDDVQYICNNNSVNAYQWNLKTNLFEWNATLTAKYTAIECK